MVVVVMGINNSKNKGKKKLVISKSTSILTALILFFTIIYCVNATEPTELNNSLKLYFPADDEGGSVVKELIGDTNGFGTYSLVPGVINESVHTAATNHYVKYENLTGRDFNLTITSISVWLNTTDDTDNIAHIVNIYDAAADNSLAVKICGGVGQVCVGGYNGSSAFRRTTNDVINNGNWYHIVGVINRDDVISSRIYINGVNQSTEWEEENLINGDFNLSYVGIGYLPSLGFTVQGDVDEVSVYEGDIGQLGVTYLYNSGVGVSYENITLTESPPNPPPTITLIRPPNNFTSNINVPQFNYTYTDENSTLGNCSIELYTYKTDYTGLVGEWLFNKSGVDTSGGGNNGTVSGGVTNATGHTGVGDTAYSFDGVNGFVNMGNPTILNINDTLTVSFWFNTANSSKRQGIISNYQNYFSELNEGRLSFRDFNDENDWKTTTFYPLNNTWYYIVFTDNRITNTINLYVNGVLNTTSDSTLGDVAGSVFGVGDLYYINASLGRPYEGLIDDVRIYNRTLNSTEILNLYHSGLSLGENQSVISGSAVKVSPNNTLADGRYDWYVSCTDGDGANTNSSIRSLWVDTVLPLASISANHFHNQNNFSTVNIYDDIIKLNVSFSDTSNLHGLSVNISLVGVVYFNFTNTSLNGTNIDYYKELNTSTWPPGVYDVVIRVADGHSAKSIGYYHVSKKKSSITFKPGNENNIKIETRESSTISTTKQKDRYTFEVSFDDKSVRDRRLDVKTSLCPLQYKDNPLYDAWFVSSCNGLDGNWIDFEGAGVPYIVTKHDDFHYSVLFFGLGPNISFSSVGGTNVNNYTFSWGKGNYSTVYNPKPALTNHSVELSLNLTSNLFQANFSAFIQFNNSNYTLSQQNYSNNVLFRLNYSVNSTPATYNFTWNVTVVQGDGSVYNATFDDSFIVLDWNITYCTTGNVTIQMNTYDEEIPANRLNTTLELELEYWITNPSISKFFRYNYAQANTFNICLDPSNRSFNADMYAQYISVNGFTHRYYLVNQSLSNTTLNVSMYNFNTTANISDLKITARDISSYDYFLNSIAKLQRRYLSEGLWRTVQMDQSGDFGTIFFNVKEEITDYRILYYDDNNHLLKQTQSLIFVCTSGICELTQLLDEYAATTVSSNLTITYNLNNFSKILQVNWSDPLGNNNLVRVRVTRETATGRSLVCEQNQSGASGTVNCNTTGFTGEVFLTVLTSNSDYKPILSAWIVLSRGALSGLISSAEAAFWTIGISVTMLGLGIGSPLIAVIAVIAALIFIYAIGIFNPLSITFIMLAMAMGIAIGIKVRQ